MKLIAPCHYHIICIQYSILNVRFSDVFVQVHEMAIIGTYIFSKHSQQMNLTYMVKPDAYYISFRFFSSSNDTFKTF